jgi:hypothetical protein
MLKRAQNYTAGAGDIFYYFAPKKAIFLLLFDIRVVGYKLLILITSLLPCSFCAFVCYTFCKKSFSAAVCGIFAVFTAIFFALGLDAYYKIADTLFLVRYKYIKGDYFNFRNLILQAQQDIKNDYTQLKKLKWSFVGWFMLSLLILPLPYVWCYYRQTKACFASDKI